MLDRLVGLEHEQPDGPSGADACIGAERQPGEIESGRRIAQHRIALQHFHADLCSPTRGMPIRCAAY
jgi:hypothetical protein